MSDSNNNQALIKSNRTYDFLKQVAQLYLPALGTLYFALAQIWGLPSGDEVVGTIVAVDSFLGVVLHISNLQYNNSESKYVGSINVLENGDAKTYSLELNGSPEMLDDKKEVTFKVKPSSS